MTKLLLTSSGLTNKTIKDALADLCRRPFSELNVAYIPTAMNVERGDKRWAIGTINDISDLGFKQFDIVEISALPLEIIKSRLEEADVLFFGGGNTYFLMDSIEKSGLKTILPELLKTRVYAGESAGSMVLSQDIILGDAPVLYQEQTNVDHIPGLGFVDFNVRPHMNSQNFPHVNEENIEMIAKKVKARIIGIDDQTAIKVVDGRVEVVTEGKWKEFNPSS